MQAQQAVDGLKVTGDKMAAKEQIKALYKTFTESDCTMVEVCPTCSIHRGAYAQCDAHMAPVWRYSTSVALQYSLLVQLLSWTLVQTLQAGLTQTSWGSCVEHGVLACRSTPWRRLRMASWWRQMPSWASMTMQHSGTRTSLPREMPLKRTPGQGPYPLGHVC